MVKPDEVMKKIRDVVENVEGAKLLTDEEMAWLANFGGVMYIVYIKALELRTTNMEVGEDIYER